MFRDYHNSRYHRSLCTINKTEGRWLQSRSARFLFHPSVRENNLLCCVRRQKVHQSRRAKGGLKQPRDKKRKACCTGLDYNHRIKCTVSIHRGDPESTDLSSVLEMSMSRLGYPHTVVVSCTAAEASSEGGCDQLASPLFAADFCRRNQPPTLAVDRHRLMPSKTLQNTLVARRATARPTFWTNHFLR